MRRVVIVMAVLAGAFVLGGYLWVQATIVLPSASCGSGGAADQTLYSTAAQVRSESGARQCFLAATRTCAAAGVAIHAPGTEESDDLVYVIDAAGSRGECRVTEYSQETGVLGPHSVQAEACQGTPVAGLRRPDLMSWKDLVVFHRLGSERQQQATLPGSRTADSQRLLTALLRSGEPYVPAGRNQDLTDLEALIPGASTADLDVARNAVRLIPGTRVQPRARGARSSSSASPKSRVPHR